MRDETSNVVMEMLNGDAIETAAEFVGIKTDNVSDIFQKILGNHFEKYTFSKKIINFINENINKERLSMKNNPNKHTKPRRVD